MRALPALLMLAACNQNMVQQPRYDSYEENPLFANGQTMQHPPEGTVSRDTAAAEAAAQPAKITPALLARGEQRYTIFCAPCHGADGRGDGVIPLRGFPHPPSYLESRLLRSPDAHFYDVISNGYGVMYSYADRVPPADRWAIVAHIRALQRAQKGEAVAAR